MTHISRRRFSGLLTGATSLICLPIHAEDFTLQAMEKSVSSDYDIPHLTPAQLRVLAASSDGKLVLMDVREVDEFAVSHVPGSNQLDPGISRRKFRKTYASKLKDKHVVFYCSVGVRSSRMALKVQKDLMSAGALGVYNLSGGIFRLHNEGQEPLQNAAGQSTTDVHPYNAHWGQLLTRGPKFHRYEP
ncbi:MAG: rhodanese-like domain-containing protein [Alphaproteobacteria bacterium]